MFTYNHIQNIVSSFSFESMSLKSSELFESSRKKGIRDSDHQMNLCITFTHYINKNIFFCEKKTEFNLNVGRSGKTHLFLSVKCFDYALLWFQIHSLILI